jgi:hypothetical protein
MMKFGSRKCPTLRNAALMIFTGPSDQIARTNAKHPAQINAHRIALMVWGRPKKTPIAATSLTSPAPPPVIEKTTNIAINGSKPPMKLSSNPTAPSFLKVSGDTNSETPLMTKPQTTPG